MAKPNGSDLQGSVDATDLDVRGDPDKEFFIENLTKDIDLIPAILDLVDNSVDAALSLARELKSTPDEQCELALGELDLSAMTINITVSSNHFVIEDNCAGMDVYTASSYAFRIGRAKTFVGMKGSVGQFGVGMKRAIFKLGGAFTVQSRSKNDWFELSLNVKEWVDLDERDWSLKFTKAATGLSNTAPGDRGTRVEVTKLHENVSESLGDEQVQSLLREQLRLRHQEALASGLTIVLNSSELLGLFPTILDGPQFGALRRQFTVSSEKGLVAVEIFAGIVSSDNQELGKVLQDAQSYRSPSEAGWWVFGNDRLLLVADKSPETGWGNGAASYHPQYRLFRGYVYMSSPVTELLPWNTTKTGVDPSSQVWKQVQSQMKVALVEVQAVLNRMKTEREGLEGDIDEAIAESSEAVYLKAAAKANPVALKSLDVRASLKLPLIPPRPRSRPRRTTQKMQYEVPLDQFELAMTKHRFATMADLGRKSFDYFYRREVDET